MITASELENLTHRLTNVRNAHDECVFCHNSRGRYHDYDCVLAKSAAAMRAMYDALDNVRTAMLPFTLGGPNV